MSEIDLLDKIIDLSYEIGIHECEDEIDKKFLWHIEVLCRSYIEEKIKYLTEIQFTKSDENL